MGIWRDSRRDVLHVGVEIVEDDGYMSIELNIDAIRVIHTGLSQAVEKWSGGNPQEQEDLIAMRDNFFRLILENQFDEF